MPQADESATDPALTIPWVGLPIIALPASVLLFAGLLLMNYGVPLGHLSAPHLANGQAEAAGRISVLGTAVLLAAVSLAAICHFARDLFRFERASRRRLLATAAAGAVVGCFFVLQGFPDDADRYLGPDFACRSFALLDPGPGAGKACRSPSYDRMIGLNHIFKYLLAFVSPALIVGTISCLGLPREPGAMDRKRALERLKTYLYLSAVLLVSGLAFLGALLQWPGFSVGEDKAFQAGVSAILLYWGIVYSIFIASYYIPVALLGARRWERLGPVGEGEPPLTAIGLLQSGAAIFAPALAGLAGGLVHL